MSSTLEEFKTKFRLDELEIHKSEFWTWSVRPIHSTLGAGILSLNRFAGSMAELTEDEATDLGVITKYIESSLKSAFKPQNMNYIMLMMVDSHLHFHILPRYSEPKEFAGFTWVDSGWPKPPAMADYEERASSEALISIRNALKS